MMSLQQLDGHQQQQHQKDERDEIVERFRAAIIGKLIDDEDFKNNIKGKQHKQPKKMMAPPKKPTRVYSRESLLKYAQSPYSTMPPENITQILLLMGEIVGKVPRKFIYFP